MATPGFPGTRTFLTAGGVCFKVAVTVSCICIPTVVRAPSHSRMHLGEAQESSSGAGLASPGSGPAPPDVKPWRHCSSPRQSVLVGGPHSGWEPRPPCAPPCDAVNSHPQTKENYDERSPTPPHPHLQIALSTLGLNKQVHLPLGFLELLKILSLIL